MSASERFHAAEGAPVGIGAAGWFFASDVSENRKRNNITANPRAMVGCQPAVVRLIVSTTLTGNLEMGRTRFASGTKSKMAQDGRRPAVDAPWWAK